jgi:hypothetical protein
MKSVIKSKFTTHPVCMLALVSFAVCASAPATAAAPDIAVCAAESALTTAADEGANAAGDAAAVVTGALGIPVSDEGLQLALSQVNGNLAAMEGPLVTIARSTCETNNTLSSSPSFLSIIPWGQGLDTEPGVLDIPVQIGGLTGISSSPMAKLVEVENTAVVTASEASLSDPEGALNGHQSDGLKNMQGIALSNIATAKLFLKEESLQTDRLKAASNITDLLATEGVIQIAAVNALNRIDEDINQLSINAAQIALNHANEEKLLKDDHEKAAVLFAVAP